MPNMRGLSCQITNHDLLDWNIQQLANNKQQQQRLLANNVASLNVASV